MVNQRRTDACINCWYMDGSDSLKMWKEYAPKNGVAIQSTIHRLAACLQDSDTPVTIGPAIRFGTRKNFVRSKRIAPSVTPARCGSFDDRRRVVPGDGRRARADAKRPSRPVGQCGFAAASKLDLEWITRASHRPVHRHLPLRCARVAPVADERRGEAKDEGGRPRPPRHSPPSGTPSRVAPQFIDERSRPWSRRSPLALRRGALAGTAMNIALRPARALRRVH